MVFLSSSPVPIALVLLREVLEVPRDGGVPPVLWPLPFPADLRPVPSEDSTEGTGSLLILTSSLQISC